MWLQNIPNSFLYVGTVEICKDIRAARLGPESESSFLHISIANRTNLKFHKTFSWNDFMVDQIQRLSPYIYYRYYPPFHNSKYDPLIGTVKRVLFYVVVPARAFGFGKCILVTFLYFMIITRASVAQWIRHWPPKPGIAGSSPAGGWNIFWNFISVK